MARSDVALVGLLMLVFIGTETASARYLQAGAVAAGLIMGVTAGLALFWGGSVIWKRL